MVGETNGVESDYLLRDKGDVCPGIDGWRRAIVKGDPVLVKGRGKHRDSACVERCWPYRGVARRHLFQAGHVRVPVNADGWFARLSSDTGGCLIRLIAWRNAAIADCARRRIRHEPGSGRVTLTGCAHFQSSN